MAAFQPDKAKLAWELTFEGAWPMAVTFVGASRRLAAGNRDGQLYLWDLPDSSGDDTPPPTRRFDGHTNGITRLVATSDGKTLISASLDRTVRLWDANAVPTGAAEVVMDIRTREKEAKRLRKDNPLNQPGVKVETLAANHVFEDHGDWVSALGLSRDDKRLISGDDKCLTIVRDIASRRQISRWTGHAGNWVTSAALSPDGTTAFTAEYSSPRGSFDRPPAQARFWNVENGAETLDVLAVQFPDVKARDNSYGYATKWAKFVARGFIAADFSPDGKLVAVGQGGETNTGQVHLLEAATGKLVRSVAGHRYGVTDVKFSPDGEYVLSTGRDTTLQICRVADGKETARLGTSRGGQFKDWLSSVSVSPDQKRIAATDIAGIVHVWDIA